RPITVAILREDAGLAVSLTDSRSIAYFGRVDLDGSVLAQIHARTARAFGRAGSPRADAGANAMRAELRALGSILYSRLLPLEIRSFLTRCPTRHLYLQVSESLMAIPWESAFDGDRTLGEKF